MELVHSVVDLFASVIKTKRPHVHLQPSELVTLTCLFALKNVGAPIAGSVATITVGFAP